MSSSSRYYLSTNRHVLVVRFTAKFVDWLNESGLELYVGKAGGAEIGSGCYLVDTPPLDEAKAMKEGCYYQEEMEEILRLSFRDIAESELLDLGLPEDNWPELETLEQFQEYFSFQREVLIADFGKRPFEARRAPV